LLHRFASARCGKVVHEVTRLAVIAQDVLALPADEIEMTIRSKCQISRVILAAAKRRNELSDELTGLSVIA
jgi:hypothetical protein